MVVYRIPVVPCVLTFLRDTFGNSPIRPHNCCVELLCSYLGVFVLSRVSHVRLWATRWSDKLEQSPADDGVPRGEKGGAENAAERSISQHSSHNKGFQSKL